jgi:hypothetical protein
MLLSYAQKLIAKIVQKFIAIQLQSNDLLNIASKRTKSKVV